MKPTFYISAPIETYSGYGARARDFVKAAIELDKFDVKVISQRWGNTPWGFLDDHKEQWGFLKQYIVSPQLPSQPDIFCQITVPNEFQPIGKFNLGVTAGIETTLCDASWIEGINRMNLTLVSSQHAKDVFLNTKYQRVDNNTKQVVGTVEIEKPIEVLFEGADLNIYKILDEIPTNIFQEIDQIPEEFAFLSVGHWMQGALGEDRKNIGMTVKAFYEVFKNRPNKPALILKTSQSGTSYMDRDQILLKLDQIRKSVNSTDLPKVYLLHGEFTDEEINILYNHPKVKAMVSLTKGEGFGRPLLEFSLVKKPIIATNWSGHIDFLSKDNTVLLGGQLTQVHPSAAVPNMILQESSWFTPDPQQVGVAFQEVFTNYNKYLNKSKRQEYRSRTKFSFEEMKTTLGYCLDRHLPEFPKQIQLKLPTLKKIELPKLTK